MQTGRPLRRIFLLIALICGLVAALAIPAGYFYVNFSHEDEELEFETRGAAARIAAYASRAGALEAKQEADLQPLITLPELEARGYGRRVLDAQQRVLIERGAFEGMLVIRDTEAIVVGGKTIGTVEFAVNLDDHVWVTLVLGAAGMLFGGLVFAVVYYIPIRTLDRTLSALEDQIAVTAAAYEALKAHDLRLQESNADLEQARAKAEESSRAKSEFLANMSHELRTPLNAIIGFSQMIQTEFAGPVPKRYLEYVGDIHKSGAHLLTIINSILDISRIEAGKVTLQIGMVPIADVVEDCCRLLRDEAAKNGVRLEADPSTAVVAADRTKLKQVLINILANALKFTGKGGTVAVRIRNDGHAVEIAVTDTGIGMNAADIALALERFRQVDGSHTRKYGGAGLGLPIAKSLIEMHGGTLSISSAPGAGTTVAIRVPQANSNEAPATAAA